MTASRPWLLALDTATSRVIVAAGTGDGDLLGSEAFAAGHRHGERLLSAIVELASGLDLERQGIAGVIAGTGPGAFTGLRVGLATAKALAHELGCPLVGVSTADALLSASGAARGVLLLPAGPHDRTVVEDGARPRLLSGGEDPGVAHGARLVAVDLEGRAPESAVAAGRDALDGLPAALLRIGAARLASGSVDDPGRLVPEYVTLPRGAPATGSDGELEWSIDRP